MTGIATAGDVSLLDRISSAADRARELSDDDVQAVLSTAPDYSSPFLRMPF